MFLGPFSLSESAGWRRGSGWSIRDAGHWQTTAAMCRCSPATGWIGCTTAAAWFGSNGTDGGWNLPPPRWLHSVFSSSDCDCVQWSITLIRMKMIDYVPSSSEAAFRCTWCSWFDGYPRGRMPVCLCWRSLNGWWNDQSELLNRRYPPRCCLNWHCQFQSTSSPDTCDSFSIWPTRSHRLILNPKYRTQYPVLPMNTVQIHMVPPGECYLTWSQKAPRQPGNTDRIIDPNHSFPRALSFGLIAPGWRSYCASQLRQQPMVTGLFHIWRCNLESAPSTNFFLVARLQDNECSHCKTFISNCNTFSQLQMTNPTIWSDILASWCR